MTEGKPTWQWSDFVALCLATYQLLLPVVIMFILSIIVVYLLFRVIFV
jgi:hypothetical protein